MFVLARLKMYLWLIGAALVAVVTGMTALVLRGTISGRKKYRHKALLTLKIPTYSPTRCPLCREGLGLDAPGSRYSGKKR